MSFKATRVSTRIRIHDKFSIGSTHQGHSAGGEGSGNGDIATPAHQGTILEGGGVLLEVNANISIKYQQYQWRLS